MDNQNTSPFNMHPAYGLADETRLQVLRDAERTSMREAAVKHRVSLSAVYKWRQVMREEANT